MGLTHLDAGVIMAFLDADDSHHDAGREVPCRMFVFVATISAHPDHADRLTEVLGESAASSRSDDGCREFSFNRDVEDPLVFRSFEVWDSVEQEAAIVRPTTRSAP